MKRQAVFCFIFLTLFCLSPLISTIPPTNQYIETQRPLQNVTPTKATEDATAFYSSSPTLPEGPTYSEGEFQYEGLGATLATTEYAQGSNLSRHVTALNYSDSAYGQVRLPKDNWTGYRLEADVYNLYDQPAFMNASRENGNFESGTTNPDDWTADYSNMGSNSSNPYFGTSWGSSYGFSGKGGRTWIDWVSLWTWGTSSYIAWQNSITIQRDNPVYAKLTFRVRVDHLSGTTEARGRLVVYAEIAGTVYRRLLDENCPNNDVWYNLSISVPYDDLLTWSVPGSIDVALGLSFTGTQQSWDSEAWALDFDDVSLEVRGLVNPNDANWLSLEMNSTTAQNPGYGYGSYAITGTWANPTQNHKRVVSIWQATDTDARLVQFDYDLTLYITRSGTTEQQVGSDGSAFVVKNNSLVYWSTWVYAYQPFYFESYNLSLTRPTTETWSLHYVLDALFDDRTSAVTTTSTHFLLSSSAIGEVFGWWNFTFTSTNRISAITTNFDSFRISPGSPSTMTISATLDTVTTGQANLTLYNPSGIAVDEETRSVSSTSVSFTDIQFDDGTTYPAGEYTLCISYDNGATLTQTAAGFHSKTIIITHATELSPDEATITVLYADIGYYYPRVLFNDTDASALIEGASVNGTVSGNPITFTQYGGLYQAQIAKHLLEPGDHLLNIDANKQYYLADSTTITIRVRGETSLSSPSSPGFTLPYGETITLNVSYWDIYNNTGVADATITTNWPTGPTGSSNGTVGWYEILIDTSDQASPGTYSLSINASKTNYQTRILVLTVVVREIATSISYSTPGSVPYGEDVVIPFNYTVTDPESQYNGNGIASVQKSDLTLTLDGSPLALSDFDFSTGAQAGMYSITILFTSGKINSIKSYSLQLKVYAPSVEYADATAAIGFNVRLLRSSLTYDAPVAEPWGNDMVIIFYYAVDDPVSGSHLAPITTIDDGLSEVSCTLNGSAVSSFGWVQIGSGQYQLTIYAADITQVIKFRLYITVNDDSDVYDGAARTMHFVIRAHQTQAIVDPPAQTALGEDTHISVQWVDLDASGDVIGNLSNVVVSNCPTGGDQTFGILSFTLITDNWSVGTHILTVTVNPDLSPSWYLGDSATVNVVIRIHYTGVTVQPPNPTPWGFNTQLIVIWTDLDTGGNVPGGELLQVVVSDCPVGSDQTFTSLTFTLNTTGWAISTGYTLNVTVYATTGPQSYSNAWASVSVVIRVHRAEVVIPTPSPTPWGFNTPMIVTWQDLDTGGTISVSNLDNITITDCPVGSDQTFGTLSFSLVASTWTIGQYTLNVTVYPKMISQEYAITSYQVTVTIRAHYVSVTVDPPAQTPWGYDTDLVITWRDVDTDSAILETNLDNVTVTGGSGGDQTFDSLSFTLDTDSWTVSPWSLTVWVYGTADYNPGSGPVTVTIRGHQTQTVVTPPQQTAFVFNTSVIVSWLDLDMGSNPVPGGNLQQIVVSNCPVGSDQTFTSLTFTLITDTWSVGTYTLTVTITSSSTSYLGSSSNTTVVIRIHYTGATAQPPDPTPWGFNTQITVLWTDLDTGNSVPGGQLFQVVVSDCPIGSDQTFTSLTFTLNTTGWAISTGYILNVTVYATTGPQSYSHAWGSVIVVVRIHRVEVVVPTPSPTPWGFDIEDMIVTWRDLDTGTLISETNLANITITDCPVGGDQISYTLNFTLITNTWSQGAYTLNVTVYPELSPQLYVITRYQVTVTIRPHYVSVTVDPPAQTPWGYDTDLVITWRDVDTDTIISALNLDNVTVTNCPVGGDQTFGSLSFTLTTNSWSVSSHPLTVWVYGSSDYVPNSGPATVTIRGHQTQTVVTPPQQTPFGFNASTQVTWLDLDQGSSSVPGGNLLQIIVSNCPMGGDQTFATLSFTLNTDTWSVGEYVVTVTTFSSSIQYLGSSSNTTVIIRIHYTGVIAQPPDPTPWGFNTQITVLWTDLDTGNSVPGGQLFQVVVSDCPIGSDQTFTSLTFTLNTTGWAISTGYTLNVTVYAVTGPKSYSDTSGPVSVVVRIHRVEVVIPTPPPTPWGFDTPMTITWNDLDTGTTINPTNLDNVTITGGPTADQDFPGLSFTLITLTWNVGAHSLTVTVYPNMTMQEYAIGTYQVSITIRPHYVSVTVDPPTPTPWGKNTQLTVNWHDVDTDTPIDIGALDNVTVTGTAPNLPYSVSLLTFTLSTGGWVVGGNNLVVYVYGNASYNPGNGPVIVTISPHQTQTIVSPPGQTPFGLNTPIGLSWVDLDLGSINVPIGNLSQIVVSNCPIGGDQTFFALTFTLSTNGWAVGSYVLTVTIQPDLGQGWYYQSSSNLTLVIRIHYTAVVVETPAPTPWGFDTNLIIHWTDLDTGLSVPLNNLSQVVISNCPIGGDQTFTSLSFSLNTTVWAINSTGYTLNVTVNATNTRFFSDAVSSVTVEIRVHRVEIVVPTPPPTPWGFDTPMTITWNDLDTGTTINPTNLDNVTITGGPTADQDFPGLSFTLVTIPWTVGAHILTVTVYPSMTPEQEYAIGTYQVTITIRAHYVSVTVDPPAAEPWGDDTQLVVYWRDVDIDALIAEINLSNVIVDGPSPDLPYIAGSLTFTLPTNTWTVGSYALIVWVFGNTNYYNSSGPVTVTIRSHAMRLDITPPSATAWGLSTHLIVKWWDLDDGAYISSDLDNITITDCPDLIDQIFYTFTFDLDTTDDSVWQSPNTYYVTVNLYSSSGQYQHASAQIPITIRIHYTNVIVQPPSPTPWGTVTPLVVEWRDLDLGNSPINPANLYRTYVYNQTSSSELEWFTQLAFDLDTTSLPPWNFGIHPINVTVFAESVGRKYADAWATTQITIRRHRVNVVINPPSTIPEGGDVNITIIWEDVDTGGDIPESYLDYVTTTGNLGYPSPMATNYTLSFILSAQGWPTVLHTLNVTVYPLDTQRYDISWGLVTIQIRRHNIRVDIDPIPQIPWNNNTWFTMRVNDSDLNSPLDGSIIRLIILAAGSQWTYDGTNWTTFVKNIAMGEYSVKLLSQSWTLGTHAIRITVITTAEYNDGTIQTSARIRKLATSFLFTPSTPTPWGNNGTLLVHYRVQDEESQHNGEEITGAIISITGWTAGIQYTYINITDGTYDITINAAYINEVKTYYLNLQISATAQFNSSSLTNVPFDVRQLFTTLAYSQVPSQPFGDDVNITVNYIVFDVQSIYHEGSIPGALITVNGLDFILGSNYQVFDMGGGVYIIEISQSVLPSIRGYHININASLLPEYRLSTIPSMTFNVRTVYTEVEKPPVEAAPYGTNFTITIEYRVRDDLSSQNGLGIPGATDIIVVAIGAWTLNLGEYSIFDAGTGFYYIYLNSSFTPYPATWQINITISWLDPIPTYRPQWVIASLTTTERPTQARITLPPDTGFADNISIHLNYLDVLSGLKIDNSTPTSDVRIYVINATTGEALTTQYWVIADYANPDYVFTIRILASAMERVDWYYDFNINVTWIGAAPFYTNSSATFTVRVAGTPTVGFADAVPGVPYGEDLNLTLHYETASGIPIINVTGYVGISVLPAGENIPGWDDSYWRVDPATIANQGAGGIYRIIIDGSKLPGFGSYVFAINFTWPKLHDPGYEDFFESTTLFVAGQVQEIITYLEWEQNGDLFYGGWLNISVWYVDTYNDENISAVIWTLNPNLDYTNRSGPLGSVILLINTSTVSAGQITFTLTANRVNYIEASRAISIQVKSHPLDLQRVSPSGLTHTCDYLDEVYIVVYLESMIDSIPIPSAYITFDWAGSSGLMTPHGDGNYSTTLYSIDTGIGTYQLVLRVEWGINYTSPILVYTLTIDPVATEMTVPLGSSVEITAYVESVIQLNISFTSSGVPIPGADVYAIEGGIKIANFTWVDPYYIVWLDTADWEIRSYQILVTAISANYEQGNQLIIINLIHKPLDIIIFDSIFVNSTTGTVETDYGDTVTFDIFLEDGLNGSGILGASLNCTWGPHEYTLTYNATHGRGWYTVNFTALDSPGSYPFKIIHEIQQKYARIEYLLTLKLNPRNTYLVPIGGWTFNTIDGVFYNISLNVNYTLWEIPRYDTLVLVFQFTDKIGKILTPADYVNATYSADRVVDLNYSLGLWYLEVNLDAYYEGALTLRFFDVQYYFVRQTFIRQLNVISIPTELRWEDLNQLPPNDIYYVGEPIILSLVYWDLYHQCPISGADFELEGSIVNSVVTYRDEDEDNPGHYLIEVAGPLPNLGTITFSTTKTDHDPAELLQFFSLQFTPLTNLLIFSGIGVAVFLIFVLILWTLYARVLSIPWEVRRLRKLAKIIEKDQTYSLGRKDRKRFNNRNDILETKVDSAMATIGVAATPAMMPVVTSIDEVTASEEDIISELDKIPGLGPEEKAVLAAEMRKIPRKDQVWFLDDLKRQMGERRMDFLTQRERPVTPPAETPPPKVPPAKKVTPPKERPPPAPPEPSEPEVPPIEEVKPVEPPDSKVFTEDRTAPTVLPPDLQPIPSEQPEVIKEIRQELDKIPGLTKEDKAALVDHLKQLSKEERQATYWSLRQTTEPDD